MHTSMKYGVNFPYGDDKNHMSKPITYTTQWELITVSDNSRIDDMHGYMSQHLMGLNGF